jgi:hypothetical protein
MNLCVRLGMDRERRSVHPAGQVLAGSRIAATHLRTTTSGGACRSATVGPKLRTWGVHDGDAGRSRRSSPRNIMPPADELRMRVDFVYHAGLHRSTRMTATFWSPVGQAGERRGEAIHGPEAAPCRARSPRSYRRATRLNRSCASCTRARLQIRNLSSRAQKIRPGGRARKCQGQ